MGNEGNEEGEGGISRRAGYKRLRGYKTMDMGNKSYAAAYEAMDQTQK
jgi:hypothetical protein